VLAGRLHVARAEVLLGAKQRGLAAHSDAVAARGLHQRQREQATAHNDERGEDPEPHPPARARTHGSPRTLQSLGCPAAGLSRSGATVLVLGVVHALTIPAVARRARRGCVRRSSGWTRVLLHL